MRRVILRNPDLSNVEKSYLTAEYTSGTTLSVVNTFAFAANDFLVVGTPGTEKAEIKKISAVASDTSLTLASALKFTHSKGSTIYECPWDTVDIEGDSGSGWSLLTNSGLQFDKQYTVYEHSSGTSSWSYRWRFKNSNDSTYSEYSPTYSGAGFDPDQVGYMIQNVRKLTNTEGDTEVIKDFEIVRALNNAQDIIYGHRHNWWFLRYQADEPAVASTFSYDLDDIVASGVTLGFVDHVKYRYTSGGTDITYRLLFKSEAEFDEIIRDNNRSTEDRVTLYTLRPPDSNSVSGYIECWPTPKNNNVGTFTVVCYRKMAELEDSIDATLVPIPSILENYAIAYVERIRGNDSKAEYYEELFFGPPPERKDIRRITGIPLLEQLQRRSVPSGQPRQLMRFRGHRAITRLYGDRQVYSRDSRENQW